MDWGRGGVGSCLRRNDGGGMNWGTGQAKWVLAVGVLAPAGER